MIRLDNANIAENYPGVCSPLTCSFAEETYRLVFARLAERLLPGRLPAVDEAVAAMAVGVEGRMYYRIDNWYRLLQFAPLRRWLIPVWQRSLAVTAADLPPRIAVGALTRLRVGWRFLVAWRRAPALMARLKDEFAQVARDFAERFDPSDPAGLRDLFGRIKSGVLRDWDITLVNDLRAFVFTALAQRLRVDVRGADLESLRPARALAELRSRPDLDGLAGVDTDAAARAFLANKTALARALADYIADFGDRVPGELKLETETFRTAPLLLVRLLRDPTVPGGADGTVSAGADGVSRARQASDGSRADGMLRSSRASDARSRRPRGVRGAVADRAARAVEHRESSRLDRARIYGMVRAIVLAQGSLLAGAGAVDDPADVFFLTLDEVMDGCPDPRGRVAERKADWAEYANRPERPRIEIDDPRALVADRPTARAATGSDDDRPGASEIAAASRGARAGRGETRDVGGPLTGTPCSAGTVEAEVIVVSDPGVDARGKIVVARATDPGWVFLLSQAAGVVAERGSILSHTAIVCRELGVPAVVGVPDATRLLRTGDRVRLDAGAGRIEVLSRG